MRLCIAVASAGGTISNVVPDNLSILHQDPNNDARTGVHDNRSAFQLNILIVDSDSIHGRFPESNLTDAIKSNQSLRIELCCVQTTLKNSISNNCSNVITDPNVISPSFKPSAKRGILKPRTALATSPACCNDSMGVSVFC